MRQDEHQVDGADAWIVDETRRILLEWIGFDPVVTPGEQQALIVREASRLQALTAAAADELEQTTPMSPASTYTDVVQARVAVWQTAREDVLARELYPRVTPEMVTERAVFDAWIEREIEREQDASREARDPDRWRTKNVRPMRAAERVVERVWLAKPAWFRRLARALVAQRIEDNQRVPMTAYDPIVDELTEWIDDEIRRHPPADPDVPF
ncbi:hypothetical protein [Prescottella subtropica]|uniref:hypothetical protein n=1 Tax=Prescottella subtropica TaxID=2545757 RepID=UPI0010F5F20B|nr:hypothetical protein [Prescottella subtropica]